MGIGYRQIRGARLDRRYRRAQSGVDEDGRTRRSAPTEGDGRGLHVGLYYNGRTSRASLQRVTRL